MYRDNRQLGPRLNTLKKAGKSNSLINSLVYNAEREKLKEGKKGIYKILPVISS